jgi:hypothetical protein
MLLLQISKNQEMGHQGKEEDTRNNTTQRLFFLFLLTCRQKSLAMWGFSVEIHSTHKEEKNPVRDEEEEEEKESQILDMKKTMMI